MRINRPSSSSENSPKSKEKQEIADEADGILPSFEKKTRQAISDAFGVNVPLPQVFGENGKLASLFSNNSQATDKNQELIDLALNGGRSGDSELTEPKVEKRPTETVISLNAPTLSGGVIEGDLRVVKESSFTLSDDFKLTRDLYAAGSPNISTQNDSTLNNVVDEDADESTNEYQLNLNGGEIGGNIHIHSTAENILNDIPSGLPNPTGTQYLEINSVNDFKSIKDWSPFANITVNAANLTIPIPAGNYQNITLNAPNKLIFTGGDYNFSDTVNLSKGSSIQIGGKTTVGIGGNFALEDSAIKLDKDVFPEDVKFNILGSSVVIGEKSEITGLLRAVNANVTVEKEAKIGGQVIANSVVMNGGTITNSIAGKRVLFAGTTTTTNDNLAVVKDGITLNGRIEGSVQQLTGQNSVLNSNAAITGDLLVPGVPQLVRNGNNGTLGGTITGTGAATPTNYQVTLNSNSSLRNLKTRINPQTMPNVVAPPVTQGTVSVVVNNSSQYPTNFTTLKDLTMNSGAGVLTLPGGTYRNITLNSNSGIKLGVAGQTAPSTYNLNSLTVNSNSQVQIAGPVILNLATGLTLNSNAGVLNNPEWLKVNVSTGGVTLNSNSSLYGSVLAPIGIVTINANSNLIGNVACKTLTINSNGLLRNVLPNLLSDTAVAITSPANNSTTVNASISVSGTAQSSAGIANVYVNEQAAVYNSANNTWTIANVALNVGSNIITVRAVDALGGEVVSQITVTRQQPVIDTTAPGITISSPANNSTTTAQTITVSGTAVDVGTNASGVQSVTVNGQTATLNANGNWTISNVPLALGANTITAKATDNAGNYSTTAITVTRQSPDTTVPTLTISSPANNSTTTNATTAVSGTVADTGTNASGVANVTVNGQNATVTNGNWTIPSVALTVGANVILVRALDNAGNVATQQITVTRNQPDTTAPTVTISTPANNSETTATTISVSGTAVDAGTNASGVATVKVNGQTATISGSNWTLANFALNLGSNTLTVVATDNAGNAANSVVTVIRKEPDTTPPTLSITAPANQSSTFDSQIMVSGTAIDEGAGATGVQSVTVNGQNTVYNSNTHQWNAANVALAIGDNLITVVASDAATPSNQSQTVIHVIRQEIPPPTVTITSPINNASTIATNLTVSGTAIANGAASNQITSVTINNQNAVYDAANRTWSLSNFPLALGVNTITAQVTDTAGKITNAAVTITRNPANQPPTVNAGPDQTGAATVGNKHNLFTMNADGSNIVQLTQNNAVDEMSDYSPDGSKILLMSYRDGNREIYLMNPDGSGTPARLTVNPADDSNPSWSPDGTKIIFTSDRDGKPQIYIMNADGSQQTRLTDFSDEFISYPRWQPNPQNPQTNGNQITFTRRFEGNYDIWSIAPDGTQVNRLTANSVGNDFANWSPDGTKLAFNSWRDGNIEIYTMNPDGSGQLRLTNYPGSDYVNTWTANGMKLIGVSDRDGNYEIYSTDAATGAQIRLTDNLADDFRPAVSRSSGKITFASNRKPVLLQGSATDDGLPQNSSLSYQWSVVNGPGAASFDAANSPATNATFATAGVYTLRLTASDGALTAFDETIVNIAAPPANQLPTVSVGEDKTVALPDALILRGFAQDDGLPIYRQIFYEWSVVGGPGGVVFDSPLFPVTNARFSALGVYTIRLSAKDSYYGQAVSDDLQVTVLPVNQPPVVNAGADQIITFPAAASLSGTVTDDGLPNNNLTVAWSKISGAGNVTFANPNSASTTASFTTSGVYVLRLTVSDGLLSTSDEISITVNPSNQPPIVNAGEDKIVALPSKSFQLIQNNLNQFNQVAANPPVVVDFDNITPGTDISNATLNGILFEKGNQPAPSAPLIVVKGNETFTPDGFYGVGDAATNKLPATTGENVLSPGGTELAPGLNYAKENDDLKVTLTEPVAAIGFDILFQEYDAYSAVAIKIYDPQGNILYENSNLPVSTGAGGGTPGGKEFFGFVSTRSNIKTIIIDEFDDNNVYPDANIGFDSFRIQKVLPNTFVTLNGAVSDDGLPNGILNANWSKISGAGTVTFANGNSTTTPVTFSEAGTYILRLTATDSALESFDEMTVTAYENGQQPPNQPPVVNAGADQKVNLPGSANLFGLVTDDGLPTGGNGSALWTKVSGPGDVAFSNPNSASTTASFSTEGIYILRLTASDGQLTASDDVAVNVNYSSNGEPLPFNYRSFNDSPWRNFSGGWFYLEDFEDHALNTPGVTAETGGLVSILFGPTAHDSVDADDGVLDGSGLNGDDFFNLDGVQGIKFVFNRQILGHYPTHVGVVYTDGAGQTYYEAFDGNGASLGVRGPFSFPDTSHFGEVTNDFFLRSYSSSGISAIRIWSINGGGVEVDHLQYGYQSNGAVNSAPTVTAGNAQTITLPTNTVTLQGAVSDDGLPAGNSLQATWTKVSGDGNVVFANANQAQTTATFAQSGVYVLKLTATDGELSSNAEVTMTVNPPVVPTPTPTVTPTPTNQPPTANAGDDKTVTLKANLLRNGSGEINLLGEIPDWAEVSGNNWTALAGGTSGVPAARFGNYVIAADGAATAELIQDVDVRAFAEKINSGTQSFTWQAYIRSAAEIVPDSGKIILEYRDQANQNTIATLDSGAISSVTNWHLTEDTRVPPAGTGFVRIRLVATRNTGATNDVFFDGLSFRSDGSVAAVKLSGAATDDGLPTGSTLQKTWSKVSGGGNVFFGNPNALDSSAVFDAAGICVLRLTATDGQLSTQDDMSVTVNAANIAPTVNAGLDRAAIISAQLQLNGTATDDNSPVGGNLHLLWEKVSGPGAVSINDSRIANPVVSFGATGVYVLRLTAEDGELETSDELTITVNQSGGGGQNQPPTVDAGNNQTIQLPTNSLTLSGTATDDGLPNNNLTVNWTKTSGAGNVTFANQNSPATTAVFSAAGSYVLRLTASDGVYVVSREVAVNVNPAGAVNQPPQVFAGADQAITLSQMAILEAAVSDDGLPIGGSFSAIWTKISGDGNVTFSNPAETATYANFSAVGVYVLRLTVSDSQLSASDDVTVTVAPNQAAQTAEILTPADGVSITEPTVVTGTISGGNWKLEYSLTDTDNLNSRVWTTFSTGTGAATGNLGTLDTTLMLNGLYDVRLSTTDQYGQISGDLISVSVENNLKVGHFTVSFDDLNVPVAGIPMQIVRTYDSRDKRKGDFGFGWTLGIKNFRVEKNKVLGLSWYQTKSNTFIPTYCVEATRPHIITVTTPSGEVEKFEARVERQCQQAAPITETRLTFAPQGKTRGTLSVSGDNTVFVAGSVPGAVELVAYDGTGIFDRAQFKYTAKDGTEFIVNQGGGLQSVKDTNNNTLTISANGITHSSGASIAFTRDAQGRITQITDPNGVSNIYTYDANGDLISYKDRANNTTSFTFEPTIAHHLKSIVDPLGRTPIRNDYDASGRLLKHTDAGGNEIAYIHNLAARVETVTDRLGNQTTFNYDNRGNVLQKTDALGNTTSFTYDGNDNTLTETNALGKTTTYTYDAQDNRTLVTDALGNRTEMTYNAKGQPLTVKDARNNTTTNTFDPAGNLLSSTDAQGNTTTNNYAIYTGKLTSTVDALGHATQFAYVGNYLTKATNAQGNQITFGYDQSGNRNSQTVKRTNAQGQLETITTTFEYDNLNRLTNVIQPDGSFIQTEYNALGQQIATIDQAGRRTEFTYDDLGRLIKTTYADGKFEESTFDAEGRRLTSKDRTGKVTSFEYDQIGRLKKTTYSDGTFTRTNYDAAGQVTSSIDAKGNATVFTYDDAGRRLTVKNALNQVSSFAYDVNGNQSSMTDALGHTTSYVYDSLNRKTKTNFADASFTETTLDQLGRRISEKDQAGKQTQFVYDSLGRLTKVKDALNQETIYGYNELGQQISQKDALNRETKFEYDKLGRRTKRILPLGQIETYSYSTDGNLSAKTDFNGKTMTFAYDTMRRLMSKTPDASLNEPTVSFTYNDAGQRATMTDASGTTNYIYDSRNRLSSKQTPEGNLSYTYDESGSIKTVRSNHANGVSVDYAYDELNRLSSVKDNRLVGNQNTTYTYDAVGNLQSYSYPNQVTTSYAYNNLNRLTTLTVSNATNGLASYAYTLGASGNRTQVVEGNGRTINYAYDDLYRLTSETIANSSNNGQITYQFDAVGNRLQRTSSVAQVSNQSSTFDANDRISSDTFDNNGSTKISNGKSYNYDFENKLTSTSDGITIVYDGDGNRVSKTVGGVTTKYLVDTNNLTGYAQVVEEIVSGQVSKQYTYGHDLISQRQASGVSFYNYDGHGSVRGLSNASGSITDSYDYDAFGTIINRTGSTDNNYLYAGEQFDADLGFYYNRARYLNIATGRFISQDSFEGNNEDPTSLHKYLFAKGNGVNLVDPNGHNSIAELAETEALGEIIETIPTAQNSLLLDEILTNYENASLLNEIIANYSGSVAASAIVTEAGLSLPIAWKVLLASLTLTAAIFQSSDYSERKGNRTGLFWDNAYRNLSVSDLEDADDFTDSFGNILEAHPNKHSIPKATQVDILNNWEHYFYGLNENGRVVGVFAKGGQVVITQDGSKNKVITAYDDIDLGRWMDLNRLKPLKSDPARNEWYWHFKRNQQR